MLCGGFRLCECVCRSAIALHFMVASYACYPLGCCHSPWICAPSQLFPALCGRHSHLGSKWVSGTCRRPSRGATAGLNLASEKKKKKSTLGPPVGEQRQEVATSALCEFGSGAPRRRAPTLRFFCGAPRRTFAPCLCSNPQKKRTSSFGND
jgi:hypothetical protein